MGVDVHPNGESGMAGREAGTRVYRAGAVAILVLAALLRFWALDSGLPSIRTRPDETEVIQSTLGPARGELDVDWVVYPSAYIYACWIWGEVGVRAGQVLGMVPEGDYAEVLRRSPEHVYLIQRVFSAVAGVAAVWLLMILTRRSLGRAPALASGLLLATCFLHVRDSHAAKPDALLSLAVLAALLAMIPLARRASLRSGVLAGLGVGVAMAAKYPGVILLAPVYAAAVMGSEARGWRRWLPAPAIAAGATAALFFVATSPYLVVNNESIARIRRNFGFVFPDLFLEPIAEDQARSLPPLEGPERSEYGSPEWWGPLLYHVRFSLRYGMGMLPTLIAPLAVAWGFASRRAACVLAASFAVVYFLVAGVSPAMMARYMTPLLPVLFFLEAGMLFEAARRYAGRGALLVLGLATLALVAEPLASAVAHNRIAARTDTRVLATRWLSEHLAPGSRLGVHGSRFWVWGRPMVPPGVKVVRASQGAAALEEAGVRYVMTHDHELFWSTVDPELFESLSPRLTLLAEFAPFGEEARPIFETTDAFYIPFHGFSGVQRPGPRVRIYAFE
jgi:4-amino-4-deoxy-L-arabinose transferase-like glycosyltransferase